MDDDTVILVSSDESKALVAGRFDSILNLCTDSPAL